MRILFNFEAEQDCNDLSISTKSIEPLILSKIEAGVMLSTKRTRGRHQTRVVLNQRPYIVEFALNKDPRDEYNKKMWAVAVQKIILDDVEGIAQKDVDALPRRPRT